MTPGDIDYEQHGAGYATQRRADPRIAACVHAALGDARTVLNVGAGAGSYEPTDRLTLAIEPSATMRAQRPSHLTPAIAAYAEALPFSDDAFDATMATITVHQWSDAMQGLRELRRVSRGPVVVLTFDGDVFSRYWLSSYAPALMAAERLRFPSIAAIAAALGDRVDIREIPIPLDCSDGFNEAYYGRPERFLDPRVRAAQSAWAKIAPDEEARIVERLRADLASGAWDASHAALRTQPTFAGSLRLVIGNKKGAQ